MNDYDDDVQQRQQQQPEKTLNQLLGIKDEAEVTSQFHKSSPRIKEEDEDEDYSKIEKIAKEATPQTNAAVAKPATSVETDREMVPFSNGAIDTGVNESATAAGLGRLGGWRGFGNAVMRNPIFMFPKRAARSVTNLSKSLWKLTKRAGRGIKNRLAKWLGSRPAVQPAEAAGEEPKEAQEPEKQEEQQPASPTIDVDSTSAYGQHMMGKAELREAMKDPQSIAPSDAPEPEGYKDTKFGNANSINWRMKTGKSVSDEERAYLRLMNAKANAITAQAKEASPENPTAFPFSQRTQADQEDTGLAKTGHVLTGIGSAINDREAFRPGEGAAAKAWDVLNAGANLGKAATKQIDKLAKDQGFDDEKLLGSAGKAYAEVGKAAQFTYGFVGSDIAKLRDEIKGNHAGHDLTKELDPYLKIKNFDKIGEVSADVIGEGKEALKYSKNVNALSLGKFVEHGATMAQAAGLGLTETYGKPFEKMHQKRADLLERQFATTVYRRMMQADRANENGLIDDKVDEERRGKEAFPNARAGFLQSVAGEAAAATKLGKEAQQAGYASNFGQDMDTTAMLNDKKHQRTYGKKFNKLAKWRNDVRLRSDASQLDDDVKSGLIGKDEEDKRRRDLAARAIAQFGIKTAYKTKNFLQSRATSKLKKLKSKDPAELQEKADSVTREQLQAASPLQWTDRDDREDAADKEQWRGLWNEQAPKSREEAISELKQRRDKEKRNNRLAQNLATPGHKGREDEHLPAGVEENPFNLSDEISHTDDIASEQYESLAAENGSENQDELKDLISQDEHMQGEEDSKIAAENGSENQDEADGLVGGRTVRRRKGLGRALAGVGQGIGKGLSTVGGVIAFDNGENDLNAGNLKTAAAKAAMSEVWQNFGTAGLSKVPVVGDYAKTVGLAVYTPAGELMKRAGAGLEELSFGKENRDRLYNEHWGLESTNATDATLEKRKELRTREKGIAGEIQGDDAKSGLKGDYFEKAQELKKLKEKGLGDGDFEVMKAQQEADAAREAVFGKIRGLREVEHDLGYSRRRQLARTGLVMPARAEADFVQPQTPLSEEQIESHRSDLLARGKAPLSAAQPKQLMVYKSKAGGSKDSGAAKDAVKDDKESASADEMIPEVADDLEESKEGDSVSGGDTPGSFPQYDPASFEKPEESTPIQEVPTERVDVMDKYAKVLSNNDREVDRYLWGEETPKKRKKRK